MQKSINSCKHLPHSDQRNTGAIRKILTDPKSERPLANINDVLCIPLYTMLKALNRTKVDYFSLDVEGFELEVLKTIPFDLIDIKVTSTGSFDL